MIIMFKAKPTMNAANIIQVCFAKTKVRTVKASRPITNRRNLYPPMRRNMCGAVKSPTIDARDAIAYASPIISLRINIERKLELM